MHCIFMHKFSLTANCISWGCSSFLFYIFSVPTKKFDTKVWRTETNKRFQMADNIIDSKLLIEKDTNQIKQLLGEPTERDSLTNWTYNMGQGGGGLGFLFHSLIVSFENEKVTRVVHAKIQD